VKGNLRNPVQLAVQVCTTLHYSFVKTQLVKPYVKKGAQATRVAVFERAPIVILTTRYIVPGSRRSRYISIFCFYLCVRFERAPHGAVIRWARKKQAASARMQPTTARGSSVVGLLGTLVPRAFITIFSHRREAQNL